MSVKEVFSAELLPVVKKTTTGADRGEHVPNSDKQHTTQQNQHAQINTVRADLNSFELTLWVHITVC